MEKLNTIDFTTELTGDELIHAIVTEVELLQSEQFDSLLPNYGRCNSVYVEEMLAKSGPEISTFYLGAGLDDTASSDCDIRLQQTKLKPLDSNTSNFVGQNCDKISPTRNDGFGVQENLTEPGAQLVAIKMQWQQQQENNSTLKSQVKQRARIETVQSHTEECNERIVNVTRCNDDVELHHESVGPSDQPMSLFQDDNIHQSDGSLHMKQVLSSRTGKVDGKRFTFELHSTEASPKNPQSSHAGSKTHSCAECKKQFCSKSNLTRHKKVHTGERPFQCEICNAAFTQADSLRSHQRIHSGEKPFQCEICNATFTQRGSLRTHQRIHSDKRPFMCNICRKSFRQKSHLATHMDIHSGRRAHKCNVCEEEFSRNPNLTKHYKIHLKEKPSQL